MSRHVPLGLDLFSLSLLRFSLNNEGGRIDDEGSS